MATLDPHGSAYQMHAAWFWHTDRSSFRDEPLFQTPVSPGVFCCTHLPRAPPRFPGEEPGPHSGVVLPLIPARSCCMEHLSSSKSHPPETGLVELHREM